LLAAGCSGGGLGGPTTTASVPSATPPAPPQSSPPSLKDKIASFFSGATQKEPQPVTNADPDVQCPFLDIRQGASTLTIPPPPPDGSNEAMSLKYQGTLVRAARDCAVVNGQMVMRLGVQGRVIVGPAGGPGAALRSRRSAKVSSGLPPGAGERVFERFAVIDEPFACEQLSTRDRGRTRERG